MALTLSELQPVLAPRFAGKTRIRGAELQAEGMVSDLRVIEGIVCAHVHGTRMYSVEVVLEPDPVIGDVPLHCTCPALARFGPCKHVWATILEVTDQLQGGESLPSPEPPSGLERLEALGLADGEDAVDPWEEVDGARQEIRYVIDVPGSLSEGALLLELRVVKRRKNGGWGRPRVYDPYRYGETASFGPLDRRLLVAFVGARQPDDSEYDYFYDTQGSRLVLAPTLARSLIGDLCATGRLFWERMNENGGPLVWDDGAPWVLRAAFEEVEEDLELSGWLERGEERMPVDEPLVLFPGDLLLTRTTVARVDHQGSFQLAADLRKQGPLRVPAMDQEELTKRLMSLPGRALVSRDTLPPIELGVPVPHLFVAGDGDERRSVLACSILFDYAGSWLAPGNAHELIPADGGARLLRRDREAERRALERFLEFGGRRETADVWHDRPGSVDAAQLPLLVRKLLLEGWKVEAESLRWQLPGKTTVSVSSGVDWFDLSGGVQYGEEVVLFPQLLAAARAGRDTVTLGDGSVGMIPERWLDHWSMLAFGEARDEGVRFQNNQAWLLDALLAERENVAVDAGFRELRKRLAGFEGVQPTQEPPSFQGELRPYQREGLGWLNFLESLGIGGCLADDMGLGKTVQVLAFLEQRRAAGQREGEAHRPTLVVAPRSLIFNWIDEAAHFTPELTTLDYTGVARMGLREKLTEYDLVLTTYGTLRRDAAFLSEVEFDCAVLDEAQAIKNSASQTAKASRLLRARQRLALSGTPIENHLGELWSLFEFLNPGMLGRSRAFSNLMSAGGNGAPDPTLLGRALRPFFLRRRKEDVLSDLPAKTEQVLHCVLVGKERQRYEELRAHYQAALLAREEEVGLGRMKIQVLEALLRLRQAACHPALLDPDLGDESSAKLDTLIPRLEEIAAEGHKAIVFSQFTSFLALIRPRLDAAGIPYEYLDGRTRNRKEKVDRFQNDAGCPLFLISIKAGGQGLNLTAADYVFLLDPWWNPAVEAQAIDRAHRIGRTRPVVAYRLIAEDTIEERVQELQARKRALAKALFDGGTGGLRGLTREELEQLFAG